MLDLREHIVFFWKNFVTLLLLMEAVAHSSPNFAKSQQKNIATTSRISSATKSFSNNKTNTFASSYYNYPFPKFALPECTTQQVCNAVYTRLDRIQSLCACPDKYVDPCSVAFNSNDDHTIELITDDSGKALTLVKTCESITTVRECRGPQDWSILALQNIRTGKSHYLVTCRCIFGGILEGPIAHKNPPYANIPGIRVYGMICHQRIGKKSQRDLRKRPNAKDVGLPWLRIVKFVKEVEWS